MFLCVCVCMLQVQCYDPVKVQWAYMLPCPFSQRCLNAVSLNGSIYVAGGLLDMLYCYSPKVDSWSKVAELPMKLVREIKQMHKTLTFSISQTMLLIAHFCYFGHNFNSCNCKYNLLVINTGHSKDTK